RKMSERRHCGGAPVEFWFDFASGYAYFGALEIEALAERHGRTVAWRPFTLGAAFKVTGAQGLSRTPLKRDYARRDWQRLARLKGVPFSLPENHPRTGLPAIRAFYHRRRGAFLGQRSAADGRAMARGPMVGAAGVRKDRAAAKGSDSLEETMEPIKDPTHLFEVERMAYFAQRPGFHISELQISP